MENRTPAIAVCIAVGLCGFGIMINGLFNKKVVDVPETTIETQISSETTTSSTNTTTTKKTTKKVIKTTKKKTTTKKVKVASYSEYQQYAKQFGNYDDTQMNCLINLWNRESGWNPNSYNKKSDACGIPQAVPCNKIKKVEGSNDWKAQIRWGIKYISYKYQTPCNALDKWNKRHPHWY